jgi:protein-tyrosine-phosphatase
MLRERDEKLAQEVEVSSAGLVTKETAEASRKKWGFIQKPFFGAPPDKGVIIAMSRRGIDISNHRSRGLNRSVTEKSALILTMEERQREGILSRYPESKGKVFTLREFVGSDGPPDIEDVVLSPASGHLLPVYLPPEYFDACISEIEGCLVEGIEKILHYLQQEEGTSSGG